MARTLEEANRIARSIDQRLAAVANPAIPDIQTGRINLDPLKTYGALTEVFPFSIPWDLWNTFGMIFSGGSSRTNAPVFEIDLSGTVLNYTMVLDFQEYEVMARVIRWGVMSIFIIGLIISTGKLIKW
jgi:hypothetical protein